MEPDDGPEEEGPFFAWLPPDDRLWRHPSEAADGEPLWAGDNPDPSGPRGPALVTTLLPAPPRPVTRIWGVAIIAGLVGALAASGVGMVSGMFAQPTTVVSAVMPTGPVVSLASATNSTVDWTAVDDAIAPSVVSIGVSTASGQASGSGVLFMAGTSKVYVITDSSLVDGGGAVDVTFLSGQQYQADIVGYDQTSGLALIAVPRRHQIFPTLGSVADLQLANPVLAVGARTAAGPGSVFPGSISAEDSEVGLTSGSAMQNLITVSNASIPGSAAGGPLVDQQGQVVGITVSLDATDPSDQDLTFAVPVDVAKQVATQLLDRVAVTHPWLGVYDAQDLTSAVAHQLGLTGGALVGQVWPDSPASRLGLDANDVITSFNGEPVTSSGTLTQLLCQAQPGHRTVIAYLHNGKLVQTSVVVSDQPPGY